MPYIWTAVHDVTYTEPPGFMHFVDDWGLNLTYDEVSNPTPPDRLIFTSHISVTNFASRSVKWGYSEYFNLGYLWLRFPGFWDSAYRSYLSFDRQYHYESKFMGCLDFPADIGNRRDIFPGIELNFNPAKVSSVRLTAWPPPIWQDD